MQKIIIDTNVFVSALIQRSYPHHIVIDVFSNDKIQLCISEELCRFKGTKIIAPKEYWNEYLRY